MFYLATITRWVSHRDSCNRVAPLDKSDGRQFLINTDRIEEMTVHGTGARFKYYELSEDPRENFDLIETTDSVIELITGADEPYVSEMVTLPIFRKNDPTKATTDTTINVDQFIYADAYNPNSDYSWVVYEEDTFKRVEVLVNLTLAELRELVYGVDGAPTDLDFSISSVDLTWTNGSTNEDGISIERSTDGVTYAEIVTVGAGVATYSDDPTQFVEYYYRVRAFRGTNYSDYSNVVHVAEADWDAYWEANIAEHDDLSLWVKSRSDGELVDDFGNNPEILTRVTNFGNANYIQTTSADFRMGTDSFAIELLASYTQGGQVIANGAGTTASPGYSFQYNVIRMASAASQFLNVNPVLNLSGQGWIHLFILINRAGFADVYRNNVRISHTDISAGAAENIDNAAAINIFYPATSNALSCAYFRMYKFTSGVPADIATYIADNYSTNKVNSNLLTDLKVDWNFDKDVFTSAYIYNTKADDANIASIGGAGLTHSYDTHGSRYNLDYGFSKYWYEKDQSYPKIEKVVPLLRSGVKRATLNATDIGLTAAPATVGYYWIEDKDGDLTGMNLADCKLRFSNDFFDRSNATIWNAVARYTTRAIITLSGNSGTADITFNGLAKTMTYGTSLTATALTFVVTNFTAYKAIGVLISMHGGRVIADTVFGTGITEATITNTSLTLNGTVITSGNYDAAHTKDFHISEFNQRSLMAMLNTGYKGLLFNKSQSRYNGADYYGSVEDLEKESLEEIILYNTDKTGTDHVKVLTYTGDKFAAVKIGSAYDYDVNNQIQLGYLKSTKPQFLIRLDDGLESEYTSWKPYFDSKGVTNINLALLPSEVDGAGYMTWAQAVALYNAGWEIDVHGDTVDNLQYADATTFQAAYENAYAAMTAHGLPLTKIVIPHNYAGSNLWARQWILKNNKAMWYVRVPREEERVEELRIEKDLMNSMSAYTTALYYDITTVGGRAAIKAQLDIAIAGNRIAAVFFHAYSINEAAGLDEIIAYALAGGMEIVTHTQALDNCKYQL